MPWAKGRRKKQISFCKVYHKKFRVGTEPVQKPSRPISLGKAKAKGGDKRATDPKGESSDCFGVGTKPVQKPSRPISLGKVKAKGGEKRAIGPKGEN